MKMMENLLKVTESQRNSIRNNVGYTSIDQINKDIEQILEWYKKQQHLPLINLDRRLIENLLISRKRSVEQTKEKIDLMFSIRNMIPEIAGPRDVNNMKIINALKGCITVVVPKLNKDLRRICIFSFKGDMDFFSPFDTINYIFSVLELRMLHDCSSGDSYIVDLEHLMFGHLTKITPTIVKYSELYIRKAYGVRVFALHIVNASPLLNTLLGILKAGMSDKIKKRISVHSSLEDLYKVVDKDILPVEYGGNERSMEEIHDSWIKELSRDDVRKFLIEQEKLRSSENLRIGGKMDDEILGIAGSFRKLEVD